MLAKEYADSNVHFMAIGKKAQEYSKKNFMATNMSEIPTDLEKLYNDLNFGSVSEVAELIMKLYREEKVDKVVVVYNHFVRMCFSIQFNC